MRRRMAAVAAAGVLAVGAGCSDAGGDVAGPLASTTSTTAREPGTTATTDTTAGRPDPDGGGRGGSGGSGGEDCGPTPVWAFAPMPRSGSQEPESDDCDDRPVEPELGTGDVQITLRWSSSADLDLHVTEPDGTEIWYQNKGPTSTGGRLDVDSNIGCDREASVENVFWPEGRMPRGEFTVEVVGYQVDGCGSGGYTVTAKVDGQQVLDERGSVTEDESESYEFET